ncbi:hypothetical protein DJ84_11870 [Halorubrum ezzemoulense]|nr:hypothetical protein DJ84_11870 [Halorubrum ezzemoulense]
MIDTSDGGTTASAASDDAADGPDDDGESTDETASDDGEGSDGEPTANGTGGGALSEEPTDDGSRSSGLIRFLFGAHKAFGGAVLVGAVHLLRHWV